MSDKPQAFIVQPEWRESKIGGASFIIGEKQFGYALRRDGEELAISYMDGRSISRHPTEAEARAAVEAAVMKALGGKSCE